MRSACGARYQLGRPLVIGIDDRAHRAAALIAKTVGGALQAGFLPAAPAPRACELCAYRAICGPHEEVRTSRYKSQAELADLAELRSQA